MRKVSFFLLVTLFSIAGYLSILATEENWVDVSEKVKPAVATVLVYNQDKEIISQGSGFFISENRFITNRHVIENANHAQIKTVYGELLNIQRLLAEDNNLDLVILSVDIPKNTINPLELSKSPPKEGQKILVVGSPLGLEHTLSNGIISSVRNLPVLGEVIQITAPISPGSSGSPVIDRNGQVVAVVVSQIKAGQNLNFSISAKRISDLIMVLSPQKNPFDILVEAPTKNPFDIFEESYQEDLKKQAQENLKKMSWPSRAVVRGWEETKGSLGALVGLGGNLGEQIGIPGSESLKNWGFGTYQAAEEEASKYPGTAWKDIKGAGTIPAYIGKGLQWGTEKILENAPNLAFGAVTTGAGALTFNLWEISWN